MPGKVLSVFVVCVISCTSLAIVRPGDEKKLKQDSFVLWDYVFN